MALLRALRASVGQRRRSWSAGPPSLPPNEGAGAHTGPPKGIAPSRSSSPPPPSLPADS